ncbi:MAG: response regulator [Candidatus Omnitrophota bacterium]|nr:response regulator [Candidatus Omnitrophota bacterium]
MKNEKKIIVIEDEKDINELIAYSLKKEGFAVSQVFDGIEAQRILENECFGIVILDIMLPGIDGFQICKAIKDNPAAFRTFIIIVSAKDHPDDKLYAHILGAHYYLTKPFSTKTLIDIVKEISTILEKEFTVSIP